MQSLKLFIIISIYLIGFINSIVRDSDMPPPFTRQLYLTNPNLSGKDCVVLQNLIVRSSFIKNLKLSGIYDQPTANAVTSFQIGNNLPLTNGTFDSYTANALLELHSCDKVYDYGMKASSLGYKYKFVVPVYKNRSIETTGVLYDADNNEILKFTARAHGHDTTSDSSVWPSYSTTDGLNEFTSNGNTPTGYMTCDLNSPEGDPLHYGPYPVNRVVTGFAGNGQFLLPNIRTGILIHTGEWPDWNETMPMPNSAGCIHAHPDAINQIWKELVARGVEIRPNPFGTLPYPFKPQGLIVVQQLDC
eukprot:TRINITY_DN29_c2_g6_i1.p1 TRINITY_DN29_c2_g6~~TRINITY_DN29_c2_g6_i1.p1  ORF type:complete len:303 (-),score=141.79 TRINITY_DN29_c2_g6_i1:54-962(-)